MENRLDELASIVEWVDDLALEPKRRLAAWHTTPVDGKTEIGPRLAAWRTQRPVLRAVPGWRSSSCPDQENAF
jgi:hypothetical protein